MSDFDNFWEIYPRKIGKIKAQKAWDRNIKGKKADPQEMIKAARNYASVRAGQDNLFTMYPSTFLGPLEWWKEFQEGIPNDFFNTDQKKKKALEDKYKDIYLS